jgi:hypothetical protein
MYISRLQSYPSCRCRYTISRSVDSPLFVLPLKFSPFSFLIYRGHSMSGSDLLSDWLHGSFATNSEVPAATLLREYIDQGHSTIPEAALTGCLLTDSSNLLLRATCVLSFVSSGVADGETAKDYVSSKVQELDDEEGLSDLTPLEILHEKYSMLK